LIVTVNPLNLLGFHNQLLGQTSGLSVTILILGILINQNDWNKLSVRSHQLNLAVLIAGLFWIYPAQLLLLGPLFVVYFIFILFDRYQSGEFASLVRGLAIVVAVLLVSVSRDFLGTIQRIRALVFYSSESEANEKGAVLYNSIFNQFSSFRGPTISSGFRVYGDSSITWPVILLYTLLLWVLILFFFTRSLRDSRFRSPRFNSEIMQILFVIYSLLVYLVLYFTQSNYLLFKQSTWFTPLSTLIIFVFLVRKILSKGISLKLRNLIVIFLVPGVFMSLWTTYVLTTRAMDGSDIPFTNSKIAFDQNLRNQMATKTNKVFINMPAMEEAAWITINVPNKGVREKIDFFGFDQQSLYLGFNRRLPDYPVTSPEDSVFVPSQSKDIFPNNILDTKPIWESGEMIETKVESINKLFAFGVGAFYPDRASASPFGDNQPFRWSNGYLSFGVFSNQDDTIHLSFPIMTGVDFVSPMQPTVNNGRLSLESKSSEMYDFFWEDIKVKKGWNSLVLQINNNNIKSVPKNSLRPDFRPLTFAIGKMDLGPV
jgi:hypothetical protein